MIRFSWFQIPDLQCVKIVTTKDLDDIPFMVHSLLSARSLIVGGGGGESTCLLNRSNDERVVFPQEVSSEHQYPLHYGLFATFNCLFKLASNPRSLTTASEACITTLMLPTLQLCPVTCKLPNSFRPSFCIFYSVLMEYSIQFLLPTFIHVVNLSFRTQLMSPFF